MFVFQYANLWSSLYYEELSESTCISQVSIQLLHRKIIRSDAAVSIVVTWLLSVVRMADEYRNILSCYLNIILTGD